MTNMLFHENVGLFLKGKTLVTLFYNDGKTFVTPAFTGWQTFVTLPHHLPPHLLPTYYESTLTCHGGRLPTYYGGRLDLVD